MSYILKVLLKIKSLLLFLANGRACWGLISMISWSDKGETQSSRVTGLFVQLSPWWPPTMAVQWQTLSALVSLPSGLYSDLSCCITSLLKSLSPMLISLMLRLGPCVGPCVGPGRRVFVKVMFRGIAVEKLQGTSIWHPLQGVGRQSWRRWNALWGYVLPTKYLSFFLWKLHWSVSFVKCLLGGDGIELGISDL